MNVSATRLAMLFFVGLFSSAMFAACTQAPPPAAGEKPAAKPRVIIPVRLTDSSGGTASTTGSGALVARSTYLIPFNFADLTGSTAYQIDPGFNGNLVSINVRATKAVTTGSKAATVTAQVNAGSVTGGVVSLSGTYALGAQQAGTAVTAANAFTSGQTIGAAVSGVTAFSEGAGVIELTVDNTDTLNAMASLIAQLNYFHDAIAAR